MAASAYDRHWLISIVFIGIVYEIGGCFFVMKGLIFLAVLITGMIGMFGKFSVSQTVLSRDTMNFDSLKRKFWQFEKGNFDSLEMEILTVWKRKFLTVWKRKFWQFGKGNFWQFGKEKFWQFGKGNFDSLKKEIFDSLEKEIFDSLEKEILKVWKRNIFIVFSTHRLGITGIIQFVMRLELWNLKNTWIPSKN
jgi:hypothetical protein